MKEKPEVMRMTNKQANAFLEAIKIIIEKSKTKEEEMSALARIQDALNGPRK
ncbi:MAG: hypothetical protein IIZ34_03830 [Eubacterium sp.]|nr:hypothetical protein [Eubacterium sp.]